MTPVDPINDRRLFGIQEQTHLGRSNRSSRAGVSRSARTNTNVGIIFETEHECKTTRTIL